jgi:hypothetical protein
MLITSRVCMVVLCLGLTALWGCSTSSSVLVTSPTPMPIKGGKAYVKTHGGSSTDIDKAFQGSLMRHNLEVVNITTDAPPPGSAGIFVTYDDTWRWDITMYLMAIHVQFFDARTNTLLVSGDWTNSAFHGFHSADHVVSQVAEDMFKKLETGR